MTHDTKTCDLVSVVDGWRCCLPDGHHNTDTAVSCESAGGYKFVGVTRADWQERHSTPEQREKRRMDARRDAIFESLRSQFGAKVRSLSLKSDDTIRITNEGWLAFLLDLANNIVQGLEGL